MFGVQDLCTYLLSYLFSMSKMGHMVRACDSVYHLGFYHTTGNCHTIFKNILSSQTNF